MMEMMSAKSFGTTPYNQHAVKGHGTEFVMSEEGNCMEGQLRNLGQRQRGGQTHSHLFG